MESRRKNPDARCVFCEIRMDSKFGGKGRKIYCDSCRDEYSRQLYNWWMRRAYQKRVGKTPEPFDPKRILQ